MKKVGRLLTSTLPSRNYEIKSDESLMLANYLFEARLNNEFSGQRN
jgi:hypothetical protein